MAPQNKYGGATVAILLLFAIVSAQAYAVPDKRAEMSPVPFVMGARYGRSSPYKNVSPRNDRFFMGGRYGKRSEPPVPPEALTRASPGGESWSESSKQLVCQYTGVYLLYRCVPRVKHNGFDKRKITDETVPGDEV